MKKMDLKTKGFQNSLTQPRLSTLLALLSAPKLVRISRMSRRLKAEFMRWVKEGRDREEKGGGGSVGREVVSGVLIGATQMEEEGGGLTLESIRKC